MNREWRKHPMERAAPTLGVSDPVITSSGRSRYVGYFINAEVKSPHPSLGISQNNV